MRVWHWATLQPLTSLDVFFPREKIRTISVEYSPVCPKAASLTDIDSNVKQVSVAYRIVWIIYHTLPISSLWKCTI